MAAGIDQQQQQVMSMLGESISISFVFFCARSFGTDTMMTKHRRLIFIIVIHLLATLPFVLFFADHAVVKLVPVGDLRGFSSDFYLR